MQVVGDIVYSAFFSLLGLIFVALLLGGVLLLHRRRVQTLEARIAALKLEANPTQTELEQLRLQGERESSVQVVLDDTEIKQACADLRVGATEIHGSWCSRYQRDEIVNYFRQEHQALMDNKNLEIHRIINPNVVGEALDEFYDLWSRSTAQDRWKIKLNPTLVDAELMFVRYAEKPPVGVIVVNEVRDSTTAPDPAVGLIFDPQRERWLKHGVNFVERWLDQISNDPKSEALTKEHVKTWDGSVPAAYDRIVWKNPDLPEFFKDYVYEEQQQLNSLLGRCAEEESDRRLTVVEVGCGTARALIGCVTPALVGRMQFLIGFDSSPGMIREAKNNLREARAEHEKEEKQLETLHRVRFTTLDGLTMNRHFENGALVSPEVRNFPGSGLAWAPDGGVDAHAYYESRKVFCCMLNTLGVFSDDTRLFMLQNMARALGSGDYLALSLLSGEIFNWGAKLFYPRIREVTRAREGDEYFDDKLATFKTTTNPVYWSRWLYEEPNGHVEDEVTIRGMLQGLEALLAPEVRLSHEVRPILGSDEGQVGNFVIIKREN